LRHLLAEIESASCPGCRFWVRSVFLGFLAPKLLFLCVDKIPRIAGWKKESLVAYEITQVEKATRTTQK
jgi:hypothetical protein